MVYFARGIQIKKETVTKTEPQQPNNAVSTGSSLPADGEGGIVSTEPNGKPTVSSASKGTENSETDKETEQKFNKGERFLLASGAESNLNPNGDEVGDANGARPLKSVQEVVAKAEEEAKELKEIL